MKNLKIPEEFKTQLLKYFTENQLLTDEVECWPYGYDYSGNHTPPDLVIFPATSEQVQNAVQLANEFKLPITARGKSTGATGGSVPISSGIIMSFEKMDKIISIDVNNHVAIVQPGVINLDLQNELDKLGFIFGPLPTSAGYSTIGGNIACNAAGSRSLRYGSCRENVLGLEFVTGNGKLIKTGSRTTKHAVGYDLTRLMIGQEGTLGIITEAILKIVPKPDKIFTFYRFFDDIESASSTVLKLKSHTPKPYSIEFIDEVCLDSIRNENSSIPDTAKALLISEMENCLEIDFIKDETNREQSNIWKIRKELSASLKKIAPKKINEDIVIPVSNLPEFLKSTYYLGDKYNIKIANFGHAGCGNIHVNLLINPDDPSEAHRAENCLQQIFELSIKLNGALSGEHGIGIEKQKFIYIELESQLVELMSDIKRVFDPNMVLNPCKILP